MGEPPSESGVSQVTKADPGAATAVTLKGAEGTLMSHHAYVYDHLQR